MRHAARVDDCQEPIVEALRNAGCKVYYLKLPLDLLVWAKNKEHPAGRTFLMECKDPDGSYPKAQVEFIVQWPGELHVVKNVRDAIKAALGEDVLL